MEKSSRAYIDSSAILRVLLNEARAINNLNSYDSLYSSLLLRVESHRILHRLLKSKDLTEQEYLTRVELLNNSLKTINLLEISKSVLSKAEQSFPLHIGTLDSIHLSSALVLRDHKIDIEIVTHDEQLGKNAIAFGFVVRGIN